MLAPRHLIFTALNGALLDPRTGSFSEAEEAWSELKRRHIAVVLLTSRTRAQIEPLRRKLGHNHPFITETGGGIFFPDGYLNIRIPGAVRSGRYLSIALGRPYAEVCTALDDIAQECAVGVVGFHHMSLREVADNAGLRPRDGELARSREFDEPFFFTSSDDRAIARFVAAAEGRGYQARHGKAFWHLSSGCDLPRAIRTLTQLVREASHSRLRSMGITSIARDHTWLRAVDQAVLLPSANARRGQENVGETESNAISGAPGPAGWNAAIFNIIS